MNKNKKEKSIKKKNLCQRKINAYQPKYRIILKSSKESKKLKKCLKKFKDITIQ